MSLELLTSGPAKRRSRNVSFIELLLFRDFVTQLRAIARSLLIREDLLSGLRTRCDLLQLGAVLLLKIVKAFRFICVLFGASLVFA